MGRVKFAGVKYILRKFNETGKRVARNGWSIAKGGYDLDWEIYYCEQVVMQCIDGKLHGGFRPFSEWTEKEEKHLINKIKAEYKDIQEDIES